MWEGYNIGTLSTSAEEVYIPCDGVTAAAAVWKEVTTRPVRSANR